MVIKFIFSTTFALRSLYTLSCRDVSILDSAGKEIVFCQSWAQYISQFQANSIPLQWLLHILELSMARSHYQMALSNQNYVHYKSRLQKKQKIKPTVSPFRIHVCNTVGNNFASQSYGNYSQKYEPITDIVANLHASRKHLIHLISRTIRQMYNIPFFMSSLSYFFPKRNSHFQFSFR